MAINYNIKGTDLSVSDEVRSYVERQLQKIEKFVGDDTTAHADIEISQMTETGQRYRAEVTLLAQSVSHRAEARGNTLHEAIDITFGELAQELSRMKGKRERLFRRAAGRMKDVLRGLRSRF